MKKDAQLIILPDIHGREFWKIINEWPDVPAIFLGDYLDPYDFEKPITPESSIENFKEIIETVRKRDNVTMLLGNHDMTYELGRRICECRTIYEHYDELRDLFWKNKDLFKIAYMQTFNGREVLFTHAGITPNYWAAMTDVPVVLGTFDEVLHRWEEMNSDHARHWDKFCNMLGSVSHFRGGWNSYSSLVWADVREHVLSDWPDEKTDVLQVFGHTLCKAPIHSSNPSYEFYMLDNGEAYYIDKDGKIRRASNDKEIPLVNYKESE